MLQNDSDELLKYKYTFPQKYAAEHISEVREELMRRGIDVLKFDDNTYIECVIWDFPSGWNEVLKEMFSELKSAGWKSDNKLKYNFSFGSITIEGLKDDSKVHLNEIVQRYIKKLHQTCTRCSSQDHVEHFEDEYLCQSCMIETFTKRTVDDFTDIGFKYYTPPIYSNEEGFFQSIRWNEIKQVRLSQEYDNLELELCKLTEDEESKNNDISSSFLRDNYINFNSDSTINFFELLRLLAINFPSESVKEQIDNVLSGLKFCKICDRRAIIINQCKICKNLHSSIENPDKRFIEKFGSAEKFIEYRRNNFLEFKDEYFPVRFIYDNDRSFFRTI
ncbi:hypothetical protein NAL32_21735 [Chryseobacterium sp. Ch-15]|uniref:Uncharacterized protein n=1 Tax=Chryseobacterium muglaense TaxID=2893752 RepID=A0A9Q3UTB9_9FLAO|nr:hypothetical protein [Chryseobacterium muglaense]MBD3907345.1 hypothetical protein [Chryseobacterium muglaense]MCC9033014.1 hypothetical protein [Chryseobacterium muglaense]MCM2557012.1 hypothetical protein [Chryseobacterium muglaense]